MKIWTKPLVKNAKRPLPVDVHHSKNVFSVSSLLVLAALKHGNIIILICHEGRGGGGGHEWCLVIRLLECCGFSTY